MQKLTYAFADGVAIAKRNVIKIKRVPEVLVSVLISPIIFVFLFAYVFGSSIEVPGGSYREFLISGIFAMTLLFGSTFTGAGLADDMQKGIIDRFRSLPMSRSAVVFRDKSRRGAIPRSSVVVVVDPSRAQGRSGTQRSPTGIRTACHRG